MESVAIATTSRSLPLRFPSTSPRRRRSFVAAAAKRRDDGEGEEAARGSRAPSSSGTGGREPTGLAPYGLSVSPFSKVRWRCTAGQQRPIPPSAAAIRRALLPPIRLPPVLFPDAIMGGTRIELQGEPSMDAAMGLVMSAATGSGWTTGSGMEGPPTAGAMDGRPEVSTLPWSLFTKSPRRRMRVAFTCNVCGQRTTRAINPHAYTDGTVFVQCCGCNVFHKLVDNLNLFHEMKCYVGPDFRYEGDAPFNYLGGDGGSEDGGPIFPGL